jgi:hypothetical protein
MTTLPWTVSRELISLQTRENKQWMPCWNWFLGESPSIRWSDWITNLLILRPQLVVSRGSQNKWNDHYRPQAWKISSKRHEKESKTVYQIFKRFQQSALSPRESNIFTPVPPLASLYDVLGSEIRIFRVVSKRPPLLHDCKIDPWNLFNRPETMWNDRSQLEDGALICSKALKH